MFISFHSQRDDDKSPSSPFSNSVVGDSCSNDSSCDSEPALCIVSSGTPERSSSVSDVTSGNDQSSEVVEKFWLSKDLVITKNNKISDERKVFNTEIKTLITCQKISYNCRTVQEHCLRCQCSTPRLHIYLLFGHRCNKSCSMSLNASALFHEDCSQTNENSDSDPKLQSYEVDDQVLSDLSMDTEYVVVSDDHLKCSSSVENVPGISYFPEQEHLSKEDIINEEEAAVSTTTKVQILNKNKRPRKRRCKRKKAAKCLDRKKTTQSLTKCVNFDNLFSTSVKLEVEEGPESIKDICGLTVDDFQKELLKFHETEKRAILPKPQLLLSDFWKDFQSLVKDEPVNENGSQQQSVDSVETNSYLQCDEKISGAKKERNRNYGVANIISPMKMKISFNFSSQNDRIDKADSNKINHGNHSYKLDMRKTCIKLEPVDEADDSQVDNNREETLDTEDTFCPKIEKSYSEKTTSTNSMANQKKQFHIENGIKQSSKIKSEITEPPESSTKNTNLSSLVSSLAPNKESEVKEWKCLKCEEVLESAQTLTKHLEEHVATGVFVCIFCQKPFKDRTNMKRHIRTHTGEKPYQCKVCDKHFSLPGNFKKHRDIHSSIRTEPCDVCGKTFKRREHLSKHRRIHTGEKPYVCSLCPSTFTARYSLHIHMNNHLGKKPYKCSYCSKCFSDRSTMRKHIRVHTGERPFKCSICSKTFAESGTLSGHMSTHNDNRPFSCGECKLTFKTNSSRRQHYKVHAGVRSYCCKYCGNLFMQKYNLTTHERIHTGEKPFTCFHCDRKFRSKSCLQKHILQTHGGEQQRRFPCSECGKRFYRSAHLRRHLDSHLGIKEFQCKSCRKKFTSKASLRNHMESFHSLGARNFPCEQCGKIFKRKIYVSTHKCSKVYTREICEDDSDELLAIKEECIEEFLE